MREIEPTDEVPKEPSPPLKPPPPRPDYLRPVETRLEIAAPAPPKKRAPKPTTASKDAAQFFVEPKEHSIVKATIVSKYFPAWANIMKTRTRTGKMAYFDLFAGPGRYDDGTASTPIKIVEATIGNPMLRDQIVTMFFDELPDCVTALKANLAALPGIGTLKHKPYVATAKAEENPLREVFATASVVPSYIFLDPFGYAGVTSKLIRDILRNWGCDIVFFLCYQRMPGAIMNDKVRSHMDELFGHDRVDRLRAALPGLKVHEKEPVILRALEESINAIGGAEARRYVQTFRFRTATGVVTHHLVFVTKHPTAHLIMKNIMAKESTGHVEGVANFEYRTNAPQALLVITSPIEELMTSLLASFPGRTISIKDIVAEHQYGTPYVEKNYQEALKRLCYDRGVVTAARGELRPALKPHKRDMPFEETYITFPD
jgi:three-Cys-motif partner protein